MEELEIIFWERNSDITLLKQEEKQYTKLQFQQRERIRSQRENWIIKIIKTVKMLSSDQKKIFYETTIRMMSYYGFHVNLENQADFDKNFTESFINLFIGFYNQCGINDVGEVKKIVRPNNTFIVIDLIKKLIETHRQFFKVKLMETYKQIVNYQEQKSKMKIFPLIASRRQLPTTEPSEPDENRKQAEDTILTLGQKINFAILDKWQNYVQYNLPSEQSLSGRMNDLYLQLLDRNSGNSFIINKFQERCYGRPRMLSYNVAGLYTQEQIKKMENKLKFDIKQKYSFLKDLKLGASSEQLRQCFKIRAEIQDSIDKIESKKVDNRTVNSWLPLVIQKSGFQHNPLSIFVLFRKDLILIEEMQHKAGISLKSYLKMVIKNKMEASNYRQGVQVKNFKRHHYIDINNAKKKELMIDQHRVYEKSKKQSIFPMLRSNQLKQENEIAIKNRSLSEHKLLPLFKNDLISKKLQGIELQTELPSSATLKMIKGKTQLSRLNIRERKESAKVPKSKVDDLIDQIVNERNMTVFH